MVERIAFKGLTSDQAEKLSNEEFLRLVPSRSRRAVKRSFVKYKALIEKAQDYKKSNNQKTIKTQIREAVIIPQWVGMKFSIHNGKEYQMITITAGMIGHRLGDFVYTTKRVQHSAPGIRATRGSKFIGEK